MPSNAPTPKKSSPPAKRRRHVAAAVTLPAADPRATQARHLDLQANILLQAGYRGAAEMLAWRAWTLREAGL